ncbi:LysR substrate-binding domain-containing protein [Psychromonas ossibalaenae]|uniref:LysR substrate-binding domain-containing protein n=1 Tax=Psychromonas ossibalaenae TaxID=444922 RepID=UPI0003754AD8|nr:LysR substrate-binding domain-containing protein [Psychromonas ossibalaenae]
MSPITLEALVVLDAIDKRGSYAAAAEQLNKVPSALSYIIQKLEEQLAVTIFQKQGRRAVLTPAGKNLLNEGRLILEATERLAEKTRTIANGWEPKLNIAISSILKTPEIFNVFSAFLQDHPTVEMDIREEILNGAWESLADDKIDLIIGASEPIPKQKGIQTVALCTFDPVFVVSPNHELAKQPQPLSIEQVSKYRTVVAHDTASQWVPLTHAVFAQDHFFYVPSIEYKINAQLAGIGCGFLPRNRIRQYLDSGELVELTLDMPRKPVQLHLAWKVVNQGKALKAVKEMLLEKKEQLEY